MNFFISWIHQMCDTMKEIFILTRIADLVAPQTSFQSLEELDQSKETHRNFLVLDIFWTYFRKSLKHKSQNFWLHEYTK